MACKFLHQGKYFQCTAAQRILIPSVLDLAVFCTREHENCPIFMAAEKDKLPERKDMHTALVTESQFEKTG